MARVSQRLANGMRRSEDHPASTSPQNHADISATGFNVSLVELINTTISVARIWIMVH